MAFLVLAKEQVQKHMEKVLASAASRVVDTEHMTVRRF